MAVDAPDAFRHPDGTLCLEGISSLPPDSQPCCEVFAGHTATCAHDLRYEWWRKSRRWVIAIAESAGGGGIMIRYCPHCGTPLVGDQLTQAQVRVDVVSAAEKERHWGDDPPQFNEIALTGNREGLRSPATMPCGSRRSMRRATAAALGRWPWKFWPLGVSPKPSPRPRT